jgi:hypothetical protein
MCSCNASTSSPSRRTSRDTGRRPNGSSSAWKNADQSVKSSGSEAATSRRDATTTCTSSWISAPPEARLPVWPPAPAAAASP